MPSVLSNMGMEVVVTICVHCKPMAATSREQLNHRRKMAFKNPEVQPYACFACDGTEWMLTDEFIVPPRKKEDPAWVRWVKSRLRRT